MTYRVGVDIGGTFTDLCAFDEKTNELHTLKVLSTPDRPGSEVMEGVRQLEARYGVKPGSITYFTHGTTVGVNTVIQRKGVKLCLFTTENFVDVLELARLKMPEPVGPAVEPAAAAHPAGPRAAGQGAHRRRRQRRHARRRGQRDRRARRRRGRSAPRASSSRSSTPTAIPRTSTRSRRSSIARRRACRCSARPTSGR